MAHEPRDLDKAAQRGEPSYVWREGQDRRFQIILAAAGDRINGTVLDNGCGVGIYLHRLGQLSRHAFGLEFDFERAREANRQVSGVVQGAGEKLPYPENSFDFILSMEVLEHVADDRAALAEMVRILRPPDDSGTGGGRLALFVPNRGYPFETHGVYWKGEYRFGNIPLVNYLPRTLRDQLAPHVRVYTARDLDLLIQDLPLKVVCRKVIYGGYDNIIARRPRFGRLLRAVIQSLEKTPLQIFGLSHFWVAEKIAPGGD